MILQLYQRLETVFTAAELAFLFPNTPLPLLKRRLSYYAKTGKLQRLRRGIYAKNNFDPLELANKIYSPSYISLQTVLQKQGLIFQGVPAITLVSFLNKEIECGDINIKYHKVKDIVLFNPAGIIKTEKCTVAVLERAFLDAVFIFKDFHIDNLRPLNWEKIWEWLPIYQSRIMGKRVKSYYRIYQKQNVESKQT